MQITVTISDKNVKQSLDYFVESNIFDTYGSDTLKKAGITTKKALVDQLMKDEKFMAQFAKELGKYIDNGDMMYDVFGDMQNDEIDKLIDKCEKADDEIAAAIDAKEAAEAAKRQAKLDKEEAARKLAEEEATVQRVVAALKKAGYKIEKA